MCRFPSSKEKVVVGEEKLRNVWMGDEPFPQSIWGYFQKTKVLPFFECHKRLSLSFALLSPTITELSWEIREKAFFVFTHIFYQWGYIQYFFKGRCE